MSAASNQSKVREEIARKQAELQDLRAGLRGFKEQLQQLRARQQATVIQVFVRRRPRV